MQTLDALRGWYGRLRLQARLTLQIILLVSVLFGALLALVLMAQDTALRGAAERKGSSLVRIFAFSSVQAVIAEDYLGLRELVRSLARQPETRYVMILDLQGRVLMHSRAADRGKLLDDPLSRRALAEALDINRPLIQESHTRGAVPLYDFAAPVLLLNERRAVARLGISLEGEMRLLRRTRDVILGLGLLTLCAGLGWARVHVRRLAQPIQALAEGARALARGDLERRIAVTRRDEIGELAIAFNDMAESLRVRFALDRELSSSLNLQTVLGSLVPHAKRLAAADLAFLACREGDEESAGVRASAGVRDGTVESWRIRPGVGWTGAVLSDGRPRSIEVRPTGDDPLEAGWATREGLTALLLVPIRVREVCVGVLGVGRRAGGCFPAEAQEILGRLADQAAVALANAFAYREIEQLNLTLEARVVDRTHRLAAANARLQELDRLKSEFVSNVSHELRTPLTAIRMSVDNLADGVAGELPPTVRRYLERVRDNTDRLVRLITDLLDLSRIEAGRLELRRAPLPLDSLIPELLEGLRPLALAKDVTLVAAPMPAPLVVQADRDKLGQVLINLVENGLKFTPAGGRVSVTCRALDSPIDRVVESARSAAPPPLGASAPTSFVEIAVEDTGEGIPAEELSAIFDKFHQVRRDGRPKARGTGLGLTISKSLVELHGGTIRVESTPGLGSRFILSLPGLEPSAPSPRTPGGTP
jgi:signal transduction histidine kinase/HAMP domain-containing protein